jgi:RimJ/RimL family protein N-acetyltransferase
MTLDGHTWVTFDDSVVGPWVAKQIDLNWHPDRCSAIGRVKDGELIAGALYENFNGVGVMAHMAACGRWANRHFLWLIFHYPFCQLKAERITVFVAEGNPKSRDFVEGLGFEFEARMERSHPSGAIFVYRMFKENCRWLRRKNDPEIDS